MHDVFISYSRVDGAFARRLHEALTTLNRNVWIDWEDIPITAEWIKEIESAIESSDTFLFIISPDSVASATCRRELGHAVRHNKRLVPVLRREAKTGVPKPLDALNWLFFQEDHDFEGALAKLLQVVETDLEWVKSHTRLETRAVEWESKGKNPSYLLHGSDLTEAEQWVAMGAEPKREPKPTALQMEYVLASRKVVTGRLRAMLGAVALGLVVAVVLAVVAWTQRQQAVAQKGVADDQRQTAQRNARAAEEQKREAQAQREVAVAGRLGAESELLRTTRADQLPCSVLLALEGMRRHPTPELEAALRKGVSLLRPAGPRGMHGEDIYKVRFSGDGKWVACVGGKRVSVFETGSGKRVASLKHDQLVTGVSFSPDGKLLATSGTEGVQLWDPSNWSIINDVSPSLASGSISFSPDGTLLAAGGWNGTVWLLEAKTLTFVRKLNHKEFIKSVGFSGDGKYLATACNDRSARVWEVANGREVARFDYAVGITAVALNEDGKRLATTSFDSAWRIWDVEKKRELRRVDLSAVSDEVAMSADGRWVATGGTDKTARIFDASTGAEVGRLTHGGEVRSVAFSPDGRWLATGGADRMVQLWEATDGREVMRIEEDAMVVAADLDASAKRLLTVGLGIGIWEVPSGRQLRRIAPKNPPASVSFSPDGKLVATAGTSEPNAHLWDAESGREVATMQHRGMVGGLVAFSSDGRFLATTVFNSAFVWRVADRKQISQMSQGMMPIEGMTFSMDGKRLTTVSGEWISISDAASGKLIKVLTVSGEASGVAISADDRWVAVCCGDRRLAVWVLEIATGKTVARLSHAADVETVAFSPNGKFLATGGGENVARVWEWESNREVERFVHRGHVMRVLFSRDGEFLMTASADRTARLWRWQRPDLVAEACRRLTRNLTQEEWKQYFGEEPYQKTCAALP